MIKYKIFSRKNKMNTQILKTTITMVLTSNLLIAGSCSGGFCGVVTPHIPSDIAENTQLKPFNISNKKNIDKSYNGWALVDNGGDNTIGENRLMSGVDINSLLGEGDKLSLFGLITSEDLMSGKLSYAYPLSWNNLIAEASYIHTNYTLDEPFPGATGIGTVSSIEGKLTYPIINSKKEIFNLSLSFNNNNINEEITHDFSVSDNEKKSYSATADIDFKIKNYPLFNLDTNHKLYIGLTSGNLSFDNIFNEQIDKLTVNTQGSYTKINIDYKNTISLSDNTSLESNFRAQYALNDKNLDDSESFTIGGTNGVKIYEEGSVYGSNGFFANIEAKYKLPEFNGIKNSIGTFYDYGQVWDSENVNLSSETITAQDTGVGIYTNYKKFFSKVQTAFELGNSEISTKDDKSYRVILQAGFIF